MYHPRVNSALQSFVESWNNHSLSSEGNLTPNQLFIRGALEQHMAPQQPHPTVNTSTTPPQSLDRVTVPRLKFQPCATLHRQLSSIDTMSPTSDFGCDTYMNVVDIVGLHLSPGCDECVEL